MNSNSAWSDLIEIGVTQGVSLKYRYTKKLVEIVYEGTLVNGTVYGAGTIGYRFPAMPSEFLPSINFRHGIFCPKNNNNLCIRIYPYVLNNWSISSESVSLTAAGEYVFGSFIYARR